MHLSAGRKLTCLLVVTLAAPAAPFAFAQAASEHYDPRIAFAPLTLPQPVNAYRSGSGAPGPAYWQNEADYGMHAVLDAKDKVLRNDETITYTNNSPTALDCLWLHLEQNICRKDSRAKRMAGQSPRRRQGAGNEESPSTDGFELDSVTIERGAKTEKANYLVSDTRMLIRLAQPLAPKAPCFASTSVTTTPFPASGAGALRGA